MAGGDEIMELHEMTNVPGARVRRKRVGRGMGSGLGKTCGSGHKGQMARKGHKRKAGFEGGQMPLTRRVPKRGFSNPAECRFTPVNVGALDAFADDTDVTPEVMVGAGLAKQVKDGIKVLGQGDLSKKLRVSATAFSASARAKIETAGGTCTLVK